MDEKKMSILELIKEKGIVKNHELRAVAQASESTVRRYLLELEEEKLIKRIRGGAKLLKSLETERNMWEKSFINVHEKEAIAKLAVSQLEGGDVIFLDAGTTTGFMIPYLQQSQLNIKVVTNSVYHASRLNDAGIETLIIGGSIKQTTQAVVGSTAVRQLEGYRFNKVFLGMNGIDAEAGYTTPDVEEAAIKETVIKQGMETFILADSSKFGNVAFAKVADLEAATIVANEEPSSSISNQTKVLINKEVIS